MDQQHVFGVVVNKLSTGAFLVKPDAPIECGHAASAGVLACTQEHLIHGYLAGGRFIIDGNDAPEYSERMHGDFTAKIKHTPFKGERVLVTVVEDGDRFVAQFWALERYVIDSVRRISARKAEAQRVAMEQERRRQEQERLRLEQEARAQRAREQMKVANSGLVGLIGSNLQLFLNTRPTLAEPVPSDSSVEQAHAPVEVSTEVVPMAESQQPVGGRKATQARRTAAVMPLKGKINGASIEDARPVVQA